MENHHRTLNAVMLSYASAMACAQSLETDLAFILTFSPDQAVGSPEEVIARVVETQERLTRMTLGQLRARFSDVFNPSEEEMDVLIEANTVRNRLAHRFFAESYASIIDSQQHTALREELDESRDKLEAASIIIRPYSRRILSAFQAVAQAHPQGSDIAALSTRILSGANQGEGL